jgi:hypothetical protein
MSDPTIPEFFAPDSRGESQNIPKEIINGLESLKTSQIRARASQYNVSPSNTFAIDGIPGIPFESNQPNPDVFFQGEDIVYDLFLYHEGKPVSSDEYDIRCVIKSSPRASQITWEGFVDNGVFPNPKDSGYYELWIPSVQTEAFFAGSYYLHVMIQNRVGEGQGRYDRKYVLLQTMFNIDYSNFSPRPETQSRNTDKLNRDKLEPTWPNTPDTIGQKPLVPDSYYITNQG